MWKCPLCWRRVRFFLWLVAETPKRGWIFWRAGQTEANRSGQHVAPSVYKLKVIHAGFYFESKATKPAEMQRRWMPWNKRISSGQQSRERRQGPVVGTETGGLSYQQSGCQARRKKWATAAALAGTKQKQALNAPALWTFSAFVYILLSFHRPKSWKQPGPFFSPRPHPRTQLLL